LCSTDRGMRSYNYFSPRNVPHFRCLIPSPEPGLRRSRFDASSVFGNGSTGRVLNSQYPTNCVRFSCACLTVNFLDAGCMALRRRRAIGMAGRLSTVLARASSVSSSPVERPPFSSARVCPTVIMQLFLCSPWGNADRKPSRAFSVFSSSEFAAPQ